MIVFHILKTETALCGFKSESVPEDWPGNHKWVGFDDIESIAKANCARCREEAGMSVTAKHWLERIIEIYAVVANDERGEGVVATSIGGITMPLIAADRTRLNNILPFARDMATERGQSLKLVKFTAREDVQEILP